MENNNKYYTPTIKEFHVGFEYEFKHPSGWVKESMSWQSPHEIFADAIVMKSIKVKYLDQDDIESLGWNYIPTKSIGKTHYEGLFKDTTIGKMILEHDWLNNYITIKTMNYIRDGSGRFDGYITYVNRLIIKNKSELSKLMKQLGINGK
jgi:hypothetical protein